MALATYDDLLSALPNHVARGGDATLSAVLPDLVAMFEAKINYGFADQDGSPLTLLVGDMEANAIGTSTNGVFDLPDDFVSWRRVTHATAGPLVYLEPLHAAAMFPDEPAGVPAYFTILGGTLLTYPGLSGDLSLDYFQAVPGLSESLPTNWLLTKRPDIYIEGLKVEIYRFLKDYDQANAALTALASLVRGMNGTDKSTKYSRVIVAKGQTP